VLNPSTVIKFGAIHDWNARGPSGFQSQDERDLDEEFKIQNHFGA